MILDIYQVDAFTDQAFHGNPAGVCITTHDLDADTMKNIASEMAVSETAFLNSETMNLRWFTPQVEVDICGHGTLSVAHILRERQQAATGDTLVFHTRSGDLSVTLDADRYQLNFPASTVDLSQPLDTELLTQLGLQAEQVVQSGRFDSKYFVEVKQESVVRELAPNFAQLRKTVGRGALVTARADQAPSVQGQIDIVSRYFAPWVGVDEDPVTGSAHCALATYWSERLGKTTLNAFQASERGGDLKLTLLENQRVQLIGQAVTMLSGQFHLPD